MRYADRVEAGRSLATVVAGALSEILPATQRPLVMGVPRGGVIVARPVAELIGAELGVALARKIGAPSNPELAVGAVGERGEAVIDRALVAALGVTKEHIEGAVAAARVELGRQAALYRGTRTTPDVRDRLVIIVDDGIATGATLVATLRAIRAQHPGRLVAAVPVGAADSVERVALEVDDMICATRPRRFRSVGEWYQMFGQTSDEEVIGALTVGR